MAELKEAEDNQTSQHLHQIVANDTHHIKEYETKISLALQLYSENNKRLHDMTKRRINKFILTPGLPLPYPSEHNNDEIYLSHLRYALILLKMNTETIKLTSKQKKIKGNHCPYPIFIPSNTDDQISSFKQQHNLSTYSHKIINEHQLPLELHICSHGHRWLGIYSLNPIKSKKLCYITPDQFASNLHSMFVKYELHQVMKKKKLIKIVFHICNGAFIEIDEENDNKQDIAERIKTESFIGIFKETMNGFGYNNIMVIGYRGFYTPMANGSGVRIANKPPSKNPTVDVDCKQTEYVIHSNGKVDIPRKYNLKLSPCRKPSFTSAQ